MSGSVSIAEAPSRLPWIASWPSLLLLAAVDRRGAPVAVDDAGSERTGVQFAITDPGRRMPFDRELRRCRLTGRSLAIAATRDGRRQFVGATDRFDRRARDSGHEMARIIRSGLPTICRSGSSQTRQLKRVVVAAGGQVFTVAEGGGSLGATWNSGGHHSLRRRIPALHGRRSLKGGAPTRALDTGQPVTSNPQFLPGRTTVSVYADGGRCEGRTQGVYVGSLDGTPPVRLLGERVKALYVPPDSGRGPGHLVYRRRGPLMAQPFDPETVTLSGTAVPVTNRAGDQH